jgi:glycosyltransferase involved in cell wall biosynthesis
MRAELGWDDGVQIVLHAGNMGLKQGLEHVVATAHLAAQVQPQTRFVLMGDGSQRGMLESLAAGCPNIAFLPPQDADRFVDTLAAADVLLVNERSSVVDMSLPSKLTSYFVAGRPVVAAGASAGATAREVRCAGAGLTVPGEDPEALLAALVRLAGDPLLGERLGAAAAAYARNSLSPEAALARAEDFVLGLEGELRRHPAGHRTRQMLA